ncbi:MAG: EFR1 family ferrodoxin [Spirochaetes bacterium]|nr:EFR1 family ferrodoxin [Spirochaetota bacterium]
MTKIYYFSATGNSLWSAKKIAELAGSPCELYDIGKELQKDEILVEAGDGGAVVLVFPAYAFGLPLAVRNFAQRAVFKTPYLAAFVTFGSIPGGALGALSKILKTKEGIAKLYFGRIPSVENYLAIFGHPGQGKIDQRVAMQQTASEEAARAVIERRANSAGSFYPLCAFVSGLFSKNARRLHKHYKIGDACNACGTCEKICPVSAVAVKDGRPAFNDKCEHCQGCVNLCPQRAIQFGRVKFGSPGYHHPQIDTADLAR